MRAYHMTEQPYPEAFETNPTTLRVNLPREVCDPRIAADRFHRYYDEWMLADELGLDIFVNEHHQTATCMASSVVVTLSILARQTQKARLLVLGYPIGHRPDPLRAAEELCTIDTISRGRLEMGFVKGVPYEVPVSNVNPTQLMDRFWEAHDFILHAMSSRGEPFNWDGQFFHYRHVNVWPRQWQDPHPPVWITTSSKTNAAEIARRGHVMATMGTGYASKGVYDAYKQTRREMGAPAPGVEKFAYLGFMACASNEEEARRRGELVAYYPRTNTHVTPHFSNAPGFMSVEDNARLIKAGGKMAPRTLTKDGRAINPATCSLQELMDAGLMFCGTPDQLYQQIVDFADCIGGFEHFLMMGQAGFLNHADTCDSLTLFAKEVLPRLREYKYSPERAPNAA